MKLNNFIVPALVTLGLGLIGLSLWGPNSSVLLSNRSSFARLIEKNGQVTLQNNEMSAEAPLENKAALSELDILRTDENSEALIEFENGGQVRIVEQSEVLLDLLEDKSPLVVVRSGDVIVEKFGNQTQFWIRIDGQQYSATDYVLIDKKNGPRVQDELPQQNDREQVTQAEIENTLNSKKTDFFKCYGQLIQKKPQSSGQVLISFTIEPSGKLSTVEVSRSEIADTAFKSCLTEVVSRVRFRPFSGSSLTTVFPLKFE